MNDNPALTPQEIADILKISKNTVYELIKHGKLNGYRVGNKVRADLKDVEDYKNSTKTMVQRQPQKTVEPIIMSEPEPVEMSNRNFVICGQDIMLDVLSRMLSLYTRSGARILRSYAGSYNGLYALYNGDVQMATAHLWDGATNQYNIPYVKSMLPGVPTVIIHLACRMQGFYVAKGNPKGIKSWDDLRRADLTFVNRDKGSGTRILLDEHLRLMGINSKNINGYSRECLTHLAVAGTVAKGGADFALGSEKTAAQVKGVDFISLQKEQYDLIIKKENVQDAIFKTAVGIIKSDEFRNELIGIGGYDLTDIGTVVAET